ncbi:fructokinase-1 [Anaerolineaceae bacterium]|nr:fructokinase-1 [Anaerolineaceae bacterium]
MNSTIKAQMQPAPQRAVLLGDINIDISMPVAAYPPPGSDAQAPGAAWQLGGTAANTACVLAQLGLPTAIISAVGTDPWAEHALRALAQAGVNTALVLHKTNASTGLIFIAVTPDAERTMFCARGANAQLLPADISATALNRSDLVYLSGHPFLTEPGRSAAWRLVELARANKCALHLDAGLAAAQLCPQEILRLLPELALCTIGMREASALLKMEQPDAVADALLARGVRCAAIKLGAAGCLLAGINLRVRVPGFDVAEIDSTGAGDAFCAGLLFAQSCSLNLNAAGMLANALGALAVSTPGAGPQLPGAAAVLKLLHAHRATLDPVALQAVQAALTLQALPA